MLSSLGGKVSVLNVIKYSEGLAPSKRTKNKSYETLVNCAKDQFMIIAFYFFKDVADNFQTFLKGFKSEKIFEDVYLKYNAS